MRYKMIYLLIALMFVQQSFAEELALSLVNKQYESWTYNHYQEVNTNTRTYWFVDYYDISHRQNKQGDSALVLTFIPEKLTLEKVRAATIEALEDSNPGININESDIQDLVNSISMPLFQGDVITIIYNGDTMQVQYNADVVYQAKSASRESIALRNVWLGENPVDDLL